MKSARCHSCGNSSEIASRKMTEIFPVKGEPISIDSDVLVCGACGEELYDKELDTRNLERAYSAYRDQHKLLSPTEIKSIRNQYGLSQRAISRLLGWGAVTLHRYESGAIQDHSFDEMLRVLSKPENMMQLIERRGNVLSERMRERLQARISTQLQAEAIPALKDSIIHLMTQSTPDIFNGYRKFDLDKLSSMVLFFANEHLGVFKTKMNKLLWYTDFLFFKEYSVSSSGAIYKRLQFGPVPDWYESFYEIMDQEGMIDRIEVQEGDYDGEKITPVSEPEMSLFTNEEQEVLRFIGKHFRSHTCNEIKQLSHDEEAFQMTEPKHPISYEFAETLSISL